MRKKSDESISSLLIDGQIIASAKEVSNYFNKCCQKNKQKYCQVKEKTHTYPTLALKTITQFSFIQLYWKASKT